MTIVVFYADQLGYVRMFRPEAHGLMVGGMGVTGCKKATAHKGLQCVTLTTMDSYKYQSSLTLSSPILTAKLLPFWTFAHSVLIILIAFEIFSSSCEGAFGRDGADFIPHPGAQLLSSGCVGNLQALRQGVAGSVAGVFR